MIMNFKGTKGDWQIKHSESNFAFNIIGTIPGGNYKIARIPYLVVESSPLISLRNRNEAEANAKLIVKSLEMLEFLQTLENDNNTSIPEWLWKKRNDLIKNITS